MALQKVLYTATATATGGRTGTAESSDGALKLNLSTPRELGGAGDGHGRPPAWMGSVRVWVIVPAGPERRGVQIGMSEPERVTDGAGQHEPGPRDILQDGPGAGGVLRCGSAAKAVKGGGQVHAELVVTARSH